MPLSTPLNAQLISVVIPAFNEADRVVRCLRETVDCLEQLGLRYEVILVDDGSDDGTLEQARSAAEAMPRVRVVGHQVNLGKGSALARGAYAALGGLVLFVDADLEVHPRQITVLLEAMERRDADVVIGSKLHRDSRVDYPFGRRLLSLGYYLVVQALFKLPVHDTQTGLKLFRRSVVARVIPRLLVKRFAHDLELLVNVHRLGYRIVEAPVIVTRERALPRIGAGDVLFTARDTLAIWYRANLLHYYDRVGAHVDRLLSVLPQLDLDDVDALAQEGKPIIPVLDPADAPGVPSLTPSA